MSCTFTDLKKRTWTIRLNIGVVRDLKESEWKMDILSILEPDANFMGNLQDDYALVDVLWFLVGGQHEGVTDREFFTALDGEVLTNAVSAFQDAIADFFPGPKRRLIRAVIEARLENLGEAETELEEAMPELKKAIKQLLNKPGVLFGNQQESLESTLDPSPSEN